MSKNKVGLISIFAVFVALFCTSVMFFQNTNAKILMDYVLRTAYADADNDNASEDDSTELKKFDVRIDDYPVYIKYSTNVDDYDNIPEYFVIENDEIVYSRTEPGEYNKNRYRYNIRLSYSYIPYSRTEEGEKYANQWFNAGKGFYDLKITATDGNGEFEPYEIYIENFFIVQDEEGLTIPTFSAEYTGENQVATIPKIGRASCRERV